MEIMKLGDERLREELEEAGPALKRSRGELKPLLVGWLRVRRSRGRAKSRESWPAQRNPSGAKGLREA